MSDHSTNTMRARLAHHYSLIEKVLEYHFSGAVTSELLLRDQPFELLRTDCDRDVYDLVIEANGIIRHIQLKGQVLGGAAGQVTAHVKLADKPSACILWMTYDPATLRPISWRFFGGAPGERIPSLGDRLARHSRGNRLGEKGLRPNHRIIPTGLFERIDDIGHLVDRLFGTADGRRSEETVPSILGQPDRERRRQTAASPKLLTRLDICS